MGQHNTKIGDFFCDSCESEIVSERFRCLVCKSFDLCRNCHEKSVNIHSHASSHNMIKIFKEFPVDCFSIIFNFFMFPEHQKILLLNHYYYDLLLKMDHSEGVEWNSCSLFKIPTTPKPYIGSLKWVYFDRHASGPEVLTPDATKMFPNLTSLSLSFLRELKPDAFIHIPKLETIIIRDCYRRIRGFDPLDPNLFKSLKHLKVVRLLLGKYSFSEIGEFYQSMKSVEELELVHVIVEDNETFNSFRQLDNLKKLVLKQIKMKNDVGWKFLFDEIGDKVEVLEIRECSNFNEKRKVVILLAALKRLRCFFVQMEVVRMFSRRHMNPQEFDVLTKEDISKNVPENCEVTFIHPAVKTFCL